MVEPQFSGSITKGSEAKLVNNPSDAPTIYVDSFVSMLTDESVAKIGFVETLPSPDGTLVARVVLNMVINRSSLKKLSEQLSDSIVRAEYLEAQGGQ
jgi:hypothetical protein